MMVRSTVIEVANSVVQLTRREGFDPTKMRDEVTAALQPLVASDEELTMLFDQHGMTMPGVELSRIIYYCPELMMLLSRFGTDFALPTHNHGSWNVLLICRGEMHFRWYRRVDDGSVEGHAKLEIGDDVMVHGGEVAFIGPPPHDIHQLAITEPGTWMVTVTPVPEPPIRELYDVTAGTYQIGPLAVTRDAMA